MDNILDKQQALHELVTLVSETHMSETLVSEMPPIGSEFIVMPNADTELLIFLQERYTAMYALLSENFHNQASILTWQLGILAFGLAFMLAIILAIVWRP